MTHVLPYSNLYEWQAVENSNSLLKNGHNSETMMSKKKLMVPSNSVNSPHPAPQAR